MSRLSVLLIVIDTLRYDYVGYSKEYQNSITPFLDELSRNGLTYKWAFSSGTSTPFAFPGILASQYSSQNKLPGILGVKLTFARFMKEMGYETFGFNGGNIYVSNFYGYDNGLDFLEKKFGIGNKSEFKEKIKTILKNLKMLDLARKYYNKFHDFYRSIKRIIKSETTILTTENQFNKFLEIMSMNKNFFAWFDLMEVHGPYVGLWKASLIERIKIHRYFKMRRDFEKKDLITLAIETYSKALRLLDNKLEKVFNILDKRGILDNTLVIITSDHGEEFFEHGGYDHKPKPYDEIIRVPLIIYKKGESFSQIEKKEEAEKLVSLIDLAPSISQYLFGHYPSVFMGKPTLLGGNVNREYILAEGYQKENDKHLRHDPTKQGVRNWCIRTKTWKYMELNGERMFFDLERDPKENEPLSPDEYADCIGEYLKEWQREIIKGKLRMM